MGGQIGAKFESISNNFYWRNLFENVCQMAATWDGISVEIFYIYTVGGQVYLNSISNSNIESVQ